MITNNSNVIARGKFVTFEGGEGVGKTTQINLLSNKLSSLGYDVYVTREPGGCRVSEEIRAFLKKEPNLDVITDLLLVFAARREHFTNVIQPKLLEGKIVLCDRFYDSSLVYQGLLKGASVENIMFLKQLVLGSFEPDLTFVLDVPIETTIARLNERAGEKDAYDMMDVSSHSLISEGFKKISNIFSFRAVSIDAKASAQTVFAKIWKIFSKRILADAKKY